MPVNGADYGHPHFFADKHMLSRPSCGWPPKSNHIDYAVSFDLPLLDENKSMWMRMKTLTATVIVAIGCLQVAAADEVVVLVGGGFEYIHAPVNPLAPDGMCFDPPGALFNVTSSAFGGTFETLGGETIGFGGGGDATGCAYLELQFGVAAAFEGSLVFQTAEGELHATFDLLDFPTDTMGLFDALVIISFQGGTGRFEGASGWAIASGIDLPFGGLGPQGNDAGVVAGIQFGLLRLDD